MAHGARRKRKLRTADENDGSASAAQGKGSSENNEEANECLSATVVALSLAGSKLGFAVFDEAKEEIIVDEIHANQSDLEACINQIKMIFAPTLFVINTKLCAKAEIYEMLQSSIEENQKKYNVKVTKSQTWDNRKEGPIFICDTLRTKGMEDEHNRNRVYDYLSGMIKFDALEVVSSLGALLHYLKASFFSTEVHGKVSVNRIGNANLQRYMKIDPVSLKALNIFSKDSHPNILRGMGRAKEGFSLFGVLDRTRSVLGRKKLEEWMIKPLTDIEKIKRRQLGIEIMMHNEEVACQVARSLKKVMDFPKVLLRIKKVQANYTDWIKLFRSLDSSCRIRDLLMLMVSSPSCQSREEYVEFLQGFIDRLDADCLGRNRDALVAALDYELTEEQKRIIMRRGYDDQFDQFQDCYDHLEEILTTVANEVLADTPLVDCLSVQYLPQVGYLVAINANQRKFLEEDVFEFIFSEGDMVYFKNQRMRELDSDLGDLQGALMDRQGHLIRELENLILNDELALNSCAYALGELDVFISLASTATEFNFVKPEMVEDDVIIVKEGRHPLQELCVDVFIPNDTYIAPDKCLAVLTGPNFSGKSIYLKQVGILVYLAHIGSFLPCKQAIIGITDRIFTRIESLETFTLHQSTFTIDVCQMASMFHNSTPRSLCLIDEFGKGTSPLDGVALLTGCMNELARRGPKTLVALHFLKIFKENLLAEDALRKMNFFRMDIHQAPKEKAVNSQNEEEEEDMQPIVPLFKLVPGVANSSDGIACASAFLPRDIVRRAIYLGDHFAQGLAIEPSQEHLLSQRMGAVPNNIQQQALLQDVVKDFLDREDWLGCSDEELEQFLQKLRLL